MGSQIVLKLKFSVVQTKPLKPELKRWKTILYLDINLTVHHEINAIFDIKPKDCMFAKADGYPNYIKSLSSQFDTSHHL